jgi:hypothetical protein
MKIPPDAVIPADKLTKYLLTARSKDDKSKYLAQSGFSLASPNLLEAEIRRLTAETDAVMDRVKEHGVYYTVRGEIIGPMKVALPVKLVWMQRIDGIFWFVTLVPQHQ